MYLRMRNRLIPLTPFVIFVTVASLMAQDISGGSVMRDISGGAALIFRAPQNPAIHLSSGGQGTPSGGRIKNRPPKPPKQESIIARANAARSAPMPRYAEAEAQYQLAASIAPDDARAFAGLGNVYVDQGKFEDAGKGYQQAIKLKTD